MLWMQSYVTFAVVSVTHPRTLRRRRVRICWVVGRRDPRPPTQINWLFGLGFMEDVGTLYTRACYAQLQDEEKKAHLIEVATVKLPICLGYIEGVYGKRTSGEFLVYKDKPCFAEFVLLSHLLAFTTLRPTILDDFPLLSKWLAMMKGRPGIKVYIGSGKLRKKINWNPAADEPLC